MALSIINPDTGEVLFGVATGHVVEVDDEQAAPGYIAVKVRNATDGAPATKGSYPMRWLASTDSATGIPVPFHITDLANSLAAFAEAIRDGNVKGPYGAAARRIWEGGETLVAYCHTFDEERGS